MTTRQDHAAAPAAGAGATTSASGWSRTAAGQGAGGPHPHPGGQPGIPAGGERLPRPPRRRRPALAALAVLLIVGGAAVAGLLAARLDDRATVLVTSHRISAGQQITRADLAVAKVGSDSVVVIPAARAADVVGKYAAQDIAGGRLLDPSLLSSSGLLREGTAAVGIALKAGRYPASGLQSGDVVEVVRVVDGTPAVLADQATVGSVRQPGSSAFGSSGGDVVVTVVVTRRVAPAVAAAAAADQVSLVLLTRGSTAAAG